jgi:hypothetical protein
MKHGLCLLATLLLCHAISAETLKETKKLRWYKGQTHMHTLWSDGDAAPELAMKQYKEFGFDFVVMTDHNVIPDVEKWFPIDNPKLKRLTAERVEQLRQTFGADAVEVRDSAAGGKEMRLKTIDELKKTFDEKEKFLIILGEEVTSRVHINGLNLRERIAPEMKSQSNAYVMRKTVEAVDAQSKKFGVPMMAHINHPNFAEGVTPADFIEAANARYFEVYNGHGSVYNWGNPEKHMEATDRIWDIALAFRLIKEPTDILYGVGTDDAHDYYKRGTGGSIPNRGYTMVLAKALKANDLLDAILAGHFYASAGVHLDEIDQANDKLSIAIQAEPGVTYTTQFIGTRKGFDQTSTPVLDADGKPVPSGARTYSKDIGTILHETTENPATYTFKGDEIYIRAKIVSSKEMTDPFTKGDHTAAWTQPIVPR